MYLKYLSLIFFTIKSVCLKIIMVFVPFTYDKLTIPLKLSFYLHFKPCYNSTKLKTGH